MPLNRSVLRRSAAALGATAVAVALASCSSAPSGSEPAAEADPDAAVRVGLVLEPTSLDIRHTSGAALEQVLVDNVYQGLVTRTPEGEIMPALATEWQISDDGLTYTFPLHEGVEFHGGGELTASDVVASLTEVAQDETFEGHAELAGIEGIAETEGGAGVEITLAQPDQNFLFSLSGPAGLVFDEGDATDLKTAANGTGPFALDEWRQGDGITLTRFDGYWGEAAGVAEVDVSYIPDANALVNGLLSGELDAVTPVQADLLPQVEGAGDFEVVRGRTTDKYVLGFNNTAAPLDDVRVREALRLAIDHDALVETIGQGVTQYGPIPELDPGYEDLSDVAPFDPERAEELLSEAGASGLSLTLTVPNVYPTSLSNFLVSAFQDIGVELEVDSVEFSAWLNDVYTNGDYELSIVNHVEPRDVGNFADPDYYFHYDSDTVQQLYAEAMAATDVEESNVLLAEVGRQVSEDHAADWLYTAEQITALAPGVAGFPVDSLNARLPLAGVTYTGP
ncbi:ABC transporter substrate-binding protein [Microbacterium halophytorum]|uniref:ABC transporter substrate-binding protein n=1 Tax=Microbacterium halophytorum TaxID=2067568 RepID=UPI000CFB8658|nr:ABC transporter substrate-binding protein [Microbacterium halophytorum]